MRHSIAIALCVAFACAAAAKRPITHEDLWKIKRAGEPVLSPDGRWVVFALTEPEYETDKTVTDLWLVPADGSAAPRRLTSSKGAESGAAWAPDSRRVAFSAKRDGDEAPQIYIMPIDGGEAARVTVVATGAASPQFRPDGKALLFESMTYPGAADDEANRKAAAERKARKYNARAFDIFPIRYWNAWLDDTRPHVFVQDLAPGALPRDLLAGTRLAATPGFAGAFSPAGGQALGAIWSPDGAAVVFAAAVNLQETMYAETETHLFRAPLAGGEPVQLTPGGHSYAAPKFSPDGRALYALEQRNATAQRIFSLSRLARIAYPEPGAAVLLTGKWDRSVTSYTITADSASFILEAEDAGHDKLYRLPAAGGEPKLLFDVPLGGYNGPLAGPGGVLIARFGGSWQPPQIAAIEAGEARHKLLTNYDAALLADLDLAPPEHFWFTARNGKRIHSIITFPPALDRSRRYPLIVFPHGGPNAMSKDSWVLRWNYNLLTAPGYVLLQTNYTGSTGFGEQFTEDIERDVLRGPAREILEAVAEAGRRYPFIDLTRQAAIGASYGGYLMNWFEGHTDQFKCLVNHAGAVNNESQYGINDGGLGRELRMGAPIWDSPKGQWQDQSPIRYSKAWKTPMLITQGELDFRVPLSESVTTYKILQRRKVPTRLILFPEEGHWILRGENHRYHMQEVLAWLKKYL